MQIRRLDALPKVRSGALTLAAAVLVGVIVASSPATPATPVRSFTVEQATRGKEAFVTQCSNCHTDDTLHSAGLYANAGQLYGFISTQMPMNEPGSLPPEVYADIVAYFLSTNGIAPGQTELPADAAALEDIPTQPLS